MNVSSLTLKLLIAKNLSSLRTDPSRPIDLIIKTFSSIERSSYVRIYRFHDKLNNLVKYPEPL
jgi:hypothetical protein